MYFFFFMIIIWDCYETFKSHREKIVTKNMIIMIIICCTTNNNNKRDPPNNWHEICYTYVTIVCLLLTYLLKASYPNSINKKYKKKLKVRWNYNNNNNHNIKKNIIIIELQWNEIKKIYKKRNIIWLWAIIPQTDQLSVFSYFSDLSP